ncbi:hypothetical protein GCK72_022033 [Caenorhabditis remanei]|uniref:Major facilitator superfamily (MFS) profile domain-containing protein n=1 Tax=Caenorhabditis remanei TaxID=31234 RepID=A0A6A5GLB0_CAERE|nr:hypothetical protein GCK72_022033 [Caenorhabditis remanei]KAF1755464.1 hypothetical protein GCK72_022033 [Caenorhabditis remanei]
MSQPSSSFDPETPESELEESSNILEKPLKNGKKVSEANGEAHGLDDYIQMGGYVLLVCLAAELLILPQVSSMFYMMYAGAAPRVLSCDNTVFDSQLEGKEICFEIDRIGNCSHPNFQYQFKSINVEYNYFCDTSKLVKNSISIQMIGVLTGSIVFGQISDSFGRKIGTQFASIGMFIGWLIVVQSRNLLHFTVSRTILGFFTGGSVSVINVFIMENIPKKHRMWINMAITWSPNMPIYSLFAWIAGDWKTLAYINAFVCLPGFFFFQFFIHESPRWLVTKGKISEAVQVLKRQLKTSNQLHLIHEDLEDNLNMEYAKTVKQNTRKTKFSYYHLFVTPRLAMTTAALAYSYWATSIINYGVLFNMEKLSGSIYWNSVWTGLMRYACNLSFGWADLKFKRIGRKFIHTSGLVIIFISLSVVVACYALHMNHEMKDVIRISILLASSMTSQIYIADGIVANELFPTPIRTIGYSFIQTWNRVGVVCSPFIFYLADYWLALPFCCMIFFSLIDTFSFECLLPETKGRHLVEHMPPRHEWWFGAGKVDKIVEEEEDVEEELRPLEA